MGPPPVPQQAGCGPVRGGSGGGCSRAFPTHLFCGPRFARAAGAGGRGRQQPRELAGLRAAVPLGSASQIRPAPPVPGVAAPERDKTTPERDKTFPGCFLIPSATSLRRARCLGAAGGKGSIPSSPLSFLPGQLPLIPPGVPCAVVRLRFLRSGLEIVGSPELF